VHIPQEVMQADTVKSHAL